MKSKLLLVLVGVLGGFFFILFSLLVDKNVFRQVDFDTTVRLQDNISRRFDEPFSFFSDIGSFEPMLFVIVGIVGFLLLRKKWLSFLTIGFFGLFHVVEIIGKTIVEQLPPPQFLLRTKHLFEFPQFHVRLEYSYPSGHAGRALFVTVLIGILVWRSKRIPLWLKCGIVGMLFMYDCTMLVSRVYLGEHWATDVVGGALLGMSLSVISAVFY